jgi:hypothetical protein
MYEPYDDGVLDIMEMPSEPPAESPEPSAESSDPPGELPESPAEPSD